MGTAAFEAQLIEDGLSCRDLETAKQHAAGERMEVADAVVALSLVDESDSYASLAKATGLLLVDLAQREISELAVRLVSERLARRHMVVPIRVDNRTLTYATFHPFDGEAERDLTFAAGRQATNMDGYEAIAQVRHELTLTAIPIVVLTSEDGPGVERRVLGLGADDYIVKPFDAEVLLARVGAVFRRITAAAAA